MFHQTRHGAVAVVSASGPLTHERAEEFRTSMEACIGNGQPKVVLDMQQIPLLDSQALETLLDLQENYERRGEPCASRRRPRWGVRSSPSPASLSGLKYTTMFAQP